MIKKEIIFQGQPHINQCIKQRVIFIPLVINIKKKIIKGITTRRPGNYELRTDKDMIIPSYLFGKEKRENQTFKNKRNIPGPGTYNHSKEFALLRNPKYTFGYKLKLNTKSDFTPGPVLTFLILQLGKKERK